MAKSRKVLTPPDGFVYQTDIVNLAEQAELILEIEKLHLREFEFHGYLGKRRTKSFGWHYSFASESLSESDSIPNFLLPIRQKAADFAGIDPSELPHILVTEYSPGTPIGWHRDKAVFADVIGISLLSSCLFRLRKRTSDGWMRFTQTLAPRSVYLLHGPVRDQWEHSIPPVGSLRYSITFRSLKG